MEECLSGRMPPVSRLGAWGRLGAETCVTQYRKFALCRESFPGRRMAQTSDKTYLANSLTAIDPPLRKIIHYRQGRQEVCFEPVFPQSSQCTDRRSEFLLASTTVHPTYKISKSSPTYADIPCSLTSPQPTNQPRGELICPSKKLSHCLCPIPAIGVHPALKYSATAYIQPTASLQQYCIPAHGPSQRPETSCSRTTSEGT